MTWSSLAKFRTHWERLQQDTYMDSVLTFTTSVPYVYLFETESSCGSWLQRRGVLVLPTLYWLWTRESLHSSETTSFKTTTLGGKVRNGIYQSKFRKVSFGRGGHECVWSKRRDRVSSNRTGGLVLLFNVISRKKRVFDHSIITEGRSCKSHCLYNTKDPGRR